MFALDAPAAHAQRAFRAVMSAMSTPGRILTVAGGPAAPAGIAPAAFAVLTALLDYETTLWVAPTRAPQVSAEVQFRTGTRIASSPTSAAFALLDLSVDRLQLDHFAQGDPAYPDRSTTIIAEVASLDRGPPLRLTGPGIQHEAKLTAEALPTDFAAQWLANGRRFPLGVDLVLVAGDRLVALPRTVRIEGAA